MEKKFLFVCVVMTMCFVLSGCKSWDYGNAVELQETNDYDGALVLFKKVSGYKDADALANQCQAMIDAISHYEKAKKIGESKNEELVTAITKAQAVIDAREIPLDETLIPELETIISETKSIKKEIPDMPNMAEDIEKTAIDIEAIDYTSAIEKISGAQKNLENSIKQYALVDAPTESYIIKCLGKVESVKDISAATEDNDPNGNLNKAGGYTAQVYFSSDLIDQNSIDGTTIIDKGTDCGGSIEVYANVDDATRRSDYLETFDGTIFDSGSHSVVGTVLVRTSDKLTASQQKKLESDIIETLTSLE